jgi:hypothetical protein
MGNFSDADKTMFSMDDFGAMTSLSKSLKWRSGQKQSWAEGWWFSDNQLKDWI